MVTVTFDAVGSIRGTSFQGLPVYPGKKFFPGFIVTHCTIYFGQALGMGEILDCGVLVAVDAIKTAVDRTTELLEINEKRDHSPPSLGGQFRIGMTGGAIVIGLS
jgi:hypothetical protein